MKVKHLLGPVLLIVVSVLGFLIYEYVAGTNHDPSLDYILSISGGNKTRLKEPTYAIANEDGKIFIADSGNHRIAVFDKRGHFLYDIGGTGSRKPLFYPVAIGILGDKLLIGDVGSNSIFLYNQDGKYISNWTNVKGIKPFGIFIDKNKRIFVSDLAGKQILVFSKDGKLVKKIKPEKVAIDTPAGIALDSKDNLWVADSGNYNVKMIDQNGQVKEIFDGGPQKPLAMAKGLAVDSKDYIYVADTLSGEIRIFDSFGNDLESIGLSGDKAQTLHYPVGVSSYNDRIYIADQGSNNVQIWSWR